MQKQRSLVLNASSAVVSPLSLSLLHPSLDISRSPPPTTARPRLFPSPCHLCHSAAGPSGCSSHRPPAPASKRQPACANDEGSGGASVHLLLALCRGPTRPHAGSERVCAGRGNPGAGQARSSPNGFFNGDRHPEKTVTRATKRVSGCGVVTKGREYEPSRWDPRGEKALHYTGQLGYWVSLVGRCFKTQN